MYYRRKLLLGVLEAFDNRLEKMRLQKLLFLVTRFQKDKDYHFVPYKYGCYSFQSVADLSTLKKYNIVNDCEAYIEKIDNEQYLPALKPADRNAILKVRSMYGSRNTEELTRSTYISHPYYAINSLMAERLLNAEQIEKVRASRPVKNKTVLFTIGYEGTSLEEYLNKLILNDIKLLCDVRNNPLSMKYGFSKSQLKNACESIGIKYVHLPEVGIVSEKRQELNTQTDYNRLFANYKKEVLPITLETQKRILALLTDNKRIALTCFEANICQCHRKPLAEAISELEGWKYELRHI